MESVLFGESETGRGDQGGALAVHLERPVRHDSCRNVSFRMRSCCVIVLYGSVLQKQVCGYIATQRFDGDGIND
jgi:hypothetical protein